MPTPTAFAASPDRGRGLARDMRVRCALEEVGQSYEVRLLRFAEMGRAPLPARQPFGEMLTYEEGDVTLFETGRLGCTLPGDLRACCPSVRRGGGRWRPGSPG